MTTTRNPRVSSARSVADLLHDLGDIPPERVRLIPSPGKATLQDLIEANEHRDGPVCEWIDGTIVEKAVGFFESWIGSIINSLFMDYLKQKDLGMLAGEAGVLKILPSVGRAGDVTFIAWSSLPGGKPPAREDKVPEVVPDLVVEVLSESNRPAEMARKRSDYFTAGVKQVWEIDPSTETAKAYSAAEVSEAIEKGGVLRAEAILPGFQLSLSEVFARATRAKTEA